MNHCYLVTDQHINVFIFTRYNDEKETERINFTRKSRSNSLQRQKSSVVKPKSTLCDKQKLLDKLAVNGNAASKSARMCRFQDIDFAMLEWCRMARSENIPISGPMLQAKAIAVAAVMELGRFKASNGWLEEFKTRYNIKGMTVSDESVEVRRETVESWKEHLPQILAGYRAKNILNMDETCKFYLALPNKSV